jgi:hypothetical protein
MIKSKIYTSVYYLETSLVWPVKDYGNESFVCQSEKQFIAVLSL